MHERSQQGATVKLESNIENNLFCFNVVKILKKFSVLKKPDISKTTVTANLTGIYKNRSLQVNLSSKLYCVKLVKRNIFYAFKSSNEVLLMTMNFIGATGKWELIAVTKFN